MRSRTTIPALKCLRCGRKWVKRTKDLPLTCAKCRSPYWNKPRQKRKAVV